jgi:hypothetical protein
MAKSLGRQTGRTCCQGEASNIERDPHTHTRTGATQNGTFTFFFVWTVSPGLDGYRRIVPFFCCCTRTVVKCRRIRLAL